MRVQLDVASSREKQRAAGGDASEGPCLQFLQLSFWYSRLFFNFLFNRYFSPFFLQSIESREIRDLNFPLQLATLNEMHFYNRVNTRTTVFQPPTVSSSRHQDFIAKLHQVAWVASAGRSVVKSSGGASVAVSFVISRTTRVGESRERAEVGKKEFRHSARRPERTQQWPHINIITVRLG